MNENNQDFRICSVCGAKNEDDYSYCKNCGTVLPLSQATAEQNKSVTPPPFVSPGENIYADPAQFANQQNVNPPYGQPPFNAGPQGNPPPYGQPPYGAGPQGNPPPYGQPPFNAGPQGNPPPYGQAPYGAGQYPPPPNVMPVPNSIDGVATADIAAFVGSKQEYFIPKFAQNAGKSSFASWNWPVFLFGFLLNIPFVWFFYRKMYKVGAIILAIWVAITAISLCTMIYACQPIINGFVNGIEEAAPYMTAENGYSNNYTYNYSYNNNNDSYSENDQQISNIMTENIKEGMSEFLARMPFLIIGSVMSFAILALYILSAVFANSLYKKHVFKKIYELKSQRPDMSSFELNLHGGTSAGLAVATGIIVPILTSSVAWIWMFSIFSNIFSTLIL